MNIKSEKTLLVIEQEINIFLQEKNFLNIKKNIENANGSTKERVDKLVKVINKHVKNNIEKSISVYNYSFFNNERYAPIQTEYILPDGKIEYCNIGTLFAFSTEQDVMNMRIWAETTSLYVRFNERYLYEDTYHLYSSNTYKPLTIADIHKRIIRRRKDEIISEYKKDINYKESIIKNAKKEKRNIIEKLNITEKWRI